MEATSDLRVTLVHDWLTGMRGGEKCLEVLCRRFPEALLYTLLHQPGSVSPDIERRHIRTSFLQLLPQVHRYYRYLLPLMPLAARWRIAPCDLVVSFSHCVAKSACPPPGVPHVCYCFTPMRYAWHMRESYFQGGGWKRGVVETVLRRLRDWDRRTAERVTHFVAISRTVQERIRECYDRDSTVIYPPVDTDFYHPAAMRREDFYLVTSAFAPYKRLDLAIAACNRLRKRLLIIGAGQDMRQLRKMAGPTIHFLGWQPDDVVRDQMRRCRAVLFPGEEDFGIVPVEAMACGTPVIAFGRGGATETVVPLTNVGALTLPRRSAREPTGAWFAEQTADCLAAALELFENHGRDFHPLALRRQAQRFNRQRFADELVEFIDRVLHRMPAIERQAA